MPTTATRPRTQFDQTEYQPYGNYYGSRRNGRRNRRRLPQLSRRVCDTENCTNRTPRSDLPLCQPCWNTQGRPSAQQYRENAKQARANPATEPPAPATAPAQPAKPASAVQKSMFQEPPERATPAPEPVNEPADAVILALMQYREQYAQNQGGSPKQVVKDSVMEQIANRRPSTLQELGKLPGVGRTFVNRHGAAVVNIVNANPMSAEADVEAGVPTMAQTLMAQLAEVISAAQASDDGTEPNPTVRGLKEQAEMSCDILHDCTTQNHAVVEAIGEIIACEKYELAFPDQSVMAVEGDWCGDLLELSTDDFPPIRIQPEYEAVCRIFDCFQFPAVA